MVSGGRSLTTFLPAVSTRRPFSRAFFWISAGGQETSIPIINPKPRIFLTKGRSAFNNVSLISFPLAWTDDNKLSLQIWSMTAIAPAHTTGLPPKVDPWSPGAKVSANFSLQRIAPIGRPPPNPLARVIISASTQNSWKPKRWPVLPSPHWTSSKITKTSFSLHILHTSLTKALSNKLTPPSPWIASMITAHTSSVNFSLKSSSELGIT